MDPGGYELKFNDPNSQSIFASDGILGPIVKQTWEKTKFGGIPATQQLAFYVNLKEIPNNRFGTQSPAYFDDAYLNTQVGVIARGLYSLKITDPLLFVKQFVPVKYLQPGAPDFDFADMENDAVSQLFGEVVGCLGRAFSTYTNDPSRKNRIANIKSDVLGFTIVLKDTIESQKHWKENRGIEIVQVEIADIDYDEETAKMLNDVKRADALSGARGNAYMQQSVARGIEAAGNKGGGAGMAFMGMGMQAANGMMGGIQQQPTESSYQPSFAQSQQPQQPQVNPTEKLLEMKKLLDAEAITQEEYDKIKKDLLGL